MSATKLVQLVLAVAFFVASMISFIPALIRGYRENPKNPWLRGPAARKYVSPMGIFFTGCWISVAAVFAQELAVRGFYALCAVLTFFSALLYQRYQLTDSSQSRPIKEENEGQTATG